MPRTIKLDFSDFWPGFSKTENHLSQLLRTRFAIELSDEPDFLVYANFGRKHRRYECTKIFCTGENIRPDFRECDYALSFDHLPENAAHLRWPLYNWYIQDPSFLLRRSVNVERVVAEKTEFCNIVCSNPRARARIRFAEKLSRYRRVDWGGRVRNSVGGPVSDKLAFISRYKFTIAFENASHPGYTTEKIVEPMRVNSIPVYWGNPLVELDFNPRSFVNWHEHGSDEATIERIMEIDRDEALYRSLLLEPWVPAGRLTRYADPAELLAWFERIFAAEPRTRTRPSAGPWRWFRRTSGVR